MKASDLLVKSLENEGVEYIFGIPGEENLDFLDSLRDSSIQLIITRHEQSAGFMAATYGRLTGKTGVCLSTLGPGATNFTTAAAYATLGGMPMLMITGQKPINQNKQGSFQIIDTVDVMKPLTKFSKQIVNGYLIPSLVRESFRVAEEEKPGAVLLELPEDVAKEEVKNYHFFKKEKIRRPVAEEKAINNAIEAIENAKKPLILIAAGANRKKVRKWTIEFIKKTGIPFVNTQMGKGMSNAVHDYYIGTSAISNNDLVHCCIEKSDLIINIGHDTVEKPPFFMEHFGTKVIHVNFYPAHIDDVYFPHYQVVGDIGNAMWQLTEKISKKNHWNFSDFFETKNKIKEDIDKDSKSKQFPYTPQKVVHEVQKAITGDGNKDGMVCLDNGLYKIWFARNYICYHQDSLILDNALATMGAGLPSAIVTKMLYPDRKILAVCGDGGFMMNSQELETAVRLKLDLVVLILNDSAFGMIKWKQEDCNFSDFGLDLKNPNFIKYAESYGAKGCRVKEEKDLGLLLNRCLMSKGIHIIDCPIDYKKNKKNLNFDC